MAIEKVIAGIGGLAHSDERRDLYELYNGIKINGQRFSAQQIKLARMKDKQDVVLGEHFHEYWEYFAILSGKGIFVLEDTITKERRKYSLDENSGGILIPPHVAHKLVIKKNSILLGATEEQYIDTKNNDFPYPID